MLGRHEPSGRRSAHRRLLGTGALLAAAALTVGIAPSSAGASTTVNAQLSLSGIATSNNPTGGSVLGVHPGDRVTFKASTVPTAGLDKLGLGGLVSGLLDSLASFQVSADFHNLPGGKAKTVLSGAKSVAFTFSKAGTYNFTWAGQRIGVLGNVIPIDLDGNQLKAAGIKLNASNDYVGKIVVAKNPPKGGISLQLPTVKSTPEVGGHKLPGLTIPGVTGPTISTPDIGNLLPGKSNNGGGGNGDKGNKPSTHTSSSSEPSYTPPGLTIPQQVVPQGSGNYGGGSGGFYSGVLPDSVSQLGNSVPGVTGKSASSGKGATTTQNSTGKNKTIDLASSPSKPSGQLPVLLAIFAIIALALVAGTYARLFLLRQKS